MPRISRRAVALLAVALVAALAAGVGYVAYQRVATYRVVAYFASTTGLYAGDDVRVLGVKVGSVNSIEPQPGQVKVGLTLDSRVHLPADARAVTIASSLVSARFVQLAPAYTGGPALADGAVIQLERTAVPVEWDDIKTELTKLATALGPVENDPKGSFSRFIDTAANNLDGNGQSLRNAVRELSHTLSTLSDGRTDLFGTIRNLQAFVTALSNSNEQIVQFGGRLASVSEVLATSSDNLGTALDDLDVAVGDLQRFVADNRATLGESVQRLGAATQVLAEKRPQLERILHLAPTALTNFYQIYMPASGTVAGAVVLPNFRNPAQFVCGSVQALQDDDSQRSADLCAQYLAPVLNTLAINYPPIMTNAASGVHAFPSQVEYSPPDLQNELPPDAAPAPAAPVPAPPAITIPDLGGLLLPGGGR